MRRSLRTAGGPGHQTGPSFWLVGVLVRRTGCRRRPNKALKAAAFSATGLHSIRLETASHEMARSCAAGSKTRQDSVDAVGVATAAAGSGVLSSAMVLTLCRKSWELGLLNGRGLAKALMLRGFDGQTSNHRIMDQSPVHLVAWLLVVGEGNTIQRWPLLLMVESIGWRLVVKLDV